MPPPSRRPSASDFADEEVVRYLSSAIRLRHDDTGRHIERVSLAASALADWRGFKVDPARAIRLAAALHDVGKIGVPDWVVLKPGRLTPTETGMVQRHCELGHALLSPSDSPTLNLAASVALITTSAGMAPGIHTVDREVTFHWRRVSPQLLMFSTCCLRSRYIAPRFPSTRPSTS
jgi:hypothetical protein